MAGSFDENKAYAAQEDVYFDDGREIELLHYVYGRADLDELRGSPQRVLAAIDDFGREKKYLMNVGEDKGRIVADLIANKKPETIVELGGYVAYSAILFGDALRKAGGKRYLTLEKSPEFAAVIGSLVDLAGLRDVVRVVVGSSADSIRRLHKSGELKKIDMMFLDHYKPLYTPDLKLCEELGLIQPGTVLAADNVVKPGNPPYLKYVRSSVAEKKQAYGKVEDAEDSVVDTSIKGDPNLTYQSEFIESFEPTGIPDAVEITRCIGRE